MSEIEKRLVASVKMDALNGNHAERDICGKQMLEAATELSRLKEELEKAKQVCLAIDAMSNQNENMEFAIIKLLEELEKAKDQIKKCRECPEVEHNCEECDYMKVPRGKP